MPATDAILDSAAERFIAPLYRGITEAEFQALCMVSYVDLIDGMAPGIVTASSAGNLNSGAQAYCKEWRRRLMDWGVRISNDPLSK